jgi:hypothetical protein
MPGFFIFATFGMFEMTHPSYRHEFDQLTVFGVRRLIRANMFDDEKLKRAVAWLQEKGQLQDHQEEAQENLASTS